MDGAGTVRRRWIVVIGLVSCCLLFALIGKFKSNNVTLPSVVSPQEFESAREKFRRTHRRAGDQFDALYLLGQSRLEQRRPGDAIECFALIPTSHPKYGRMSRFLQGRTLLGMHRVVEAEPNLREVISLEEVTPTIGREYLMQARQRLRHILDVELRFEERHQLLRGVVDRNEDQAFESAAACFPSLGRWNGPDAILWAEHFHANYPRDVQLRIALGRYRTAQGRLEDGRAILEEVVRENPENLSALAALIACLSEADDSEAMQRVIESLPPIGKDDPWLLLLQRGNRAIQEEKPQEAKAAFEQLLRQDRSNAAAWQGLGQAARLLEDAPLRKKALEMATALGRIQNNLGKTNQAANDPNSYLDIADLCAEFGLNREGAVMVRCARRLAPLNQRVTESVERFRARLLEDNEPPLLDTPEVRRND